MKEAILVALPESMLILEKNDVVMRFCLYEIGSNTEKQFKKNRKPKWNYLGLLLYLEHPVEPSLFLLLNLSIFNKGVHLIMFIDLNLFIVPT